MRLLWRKPKYGGTFTFIENGKTSRPIPYDASLKQMNRILKKSGLDIRASVMRWK